MAQSQGGAKCKDSRVNHLTLTERMISAPDAAFCRVLPKVEVSSAHSEESETYPLKVAAACALDWLHHETDPTKDLGYPVDRA